MKKALFISSVLTLMCAMPAEAQLIRRPIVRSILSSPLTHELFRYGSSQLLPGFNPPPIVMQPPAATKITVDASVKKNLDATKTNLKAADTIVQKLLKKNGIKKGDAAESEKDEDEGAFKD